MLIFEFVFDVESETPGCGGAPSQRISSPFEGFNCAIPPEI